MGILSERMASISASYLLVSNPSGPKYYGLDGITVATPVAAGGGTDGTGMGAEGTGTGTEGVIDGTLKVSVGCAVTSGFSGPMIPLLGGAHWGKNAIATLFAVSARVAIIPGRK